MSIFYMGRCAFSVFTFLDEHQEEHPAFKKLSDEVPAWLSVCSKLLDDLQLTQLPPHHLLLH